MKSSWDKHVEDARSREGAYASLPGEQWGCFYLMHVRTKLVAIVSCGSPEIPWEHVSVRAVDWKGDRIPTWREMCWVRDLFWGPEECVVQYHPPHSEYVNTHPCVLHLWRPTNAVLPRPPMIAV